MLNKMNVTFFALSDVSNQSFVARTMLRLENPMDKMPALQYFFMISLGLQAIFGLIGNFLVIGAVGIVPALRTTGNYFIVNLSLADLFVNFVTQPFNMVGALLGEQWFKDRPTLCAVTSTLCGTGCLASTWNICMIAVNRYVLLCHQQRYDKIYTKCKTILMCLLVWGMIYLIEIPNHFGWGDIRFSVILLMCTFATHVPSYSAFYFGVGVVIPVGISFLSYLFIYRKVKDSQMVRNRILMNRPTTHRESATQEERKQRNTARRHFRENVKIAQSLFRVFVVFVVMWLPAVIIVLVGKGLQVHHVWYILTLLMAHGNSSINCILYAASIEHFREGYYRLLRIKHSRNAVGLISNTAGGSSTNNVGMSTSIRRLPSIKGSILETTRV